MIHTISYDDSRAIALALSAARRLTIGAPTAGELAKARELLDAEAVTDLLEEFHPEGFEEEEEKARAAQARRDGSSRPRAALSFDDHPDDDGEPRLLGDDELDELGGFEGLELEGGE